VNVGITIVDLDDRGRLTLPSDIRRNKNLDKKVLVIYAGDHIKLIPLPEDPFMELEGAISINTPFNELRKKALQEAQKETETHVTP
jgi:bifunctional DNA-binding transcriptional regulator/antitoxin component of YhaV-PrlF toxin-antitoxin module